MLIRIGLVIKNQIKMKLTESKLRELIKKAIKELDFKDKESFQKYKSKHKMRPSTKVNIGGKETTVGKADTDNGESEKADYDEASWNMDKWMPDDYDTQQEFYYIVDEEDDPAVQLEDMIELLKNEADEDTLARRYGITDIEKLAKELIKNK